MPSAIIHYNNPKALRLLKEMGNFMGFSIDANTEVGNGVTGASAEASGFINGIPYQVSNPKADINKLLGIFDGEGYTKETLRDKAWKKRS